MKYYYAIRVWTPYCDEIDTFYYCSSIEDEKARKTAVNEVAADFEYENAMMWYYANDLDESEEDYLEFCGCEIKEISEEEYNEAIAELE